MEDIFLVIPVLDPEERLLHLLDGVRQISDIPVILVDDGTTKVSSLQYIDRAASLSGVHLLRHGINRGKGRALKTAFEYFLDIAPAGIGVVTADGDGQHTPQDILKCVSQLRSDPSRIVLGCRDFSGDSVPWKSRFGNQLTRGVFYLGSRRRFSDTQTGLRGIPSASMKRLINSRGERFEFETTMLLDEAEAGTEFNEVAIETVYLDGNRGTHFRPVRDSLAIYKLIFKHIFRQIILFAFSGVLSAVLDLFLFWLLFEYLFRNSGMRLLISVAAARCASLIFNYLLNRFWVFGRSREESNGGIAFAQYLLLAALIMAGSYLLTKGISLAMPSANLVAGKAAVDILLFFVSYFIQKQFIFCKRKNRL